MTTLSRGGGPGALELCLCCLSFYVSLCPFRGEGSVSLLASAVGMGRRVGGHGRSHGDGNGHPALSLADLLPLLLVSVQRPQALFGVSMQLFHARGPSGRQEHIPLQVPWSLIMSTQFTLNVQIRQRHCLLFGVERAGALLDPAHLLPERTDAPVRGEQLVLQLLEERAGVFGQIRQLAQGPGQSHITEGAQVLEQETLIIRFRASAQPLGLHDPLGKWHSVM